MWGEGAFISPSSHLSSHNGPSSWAGGMCPFRHISGEKTVVCKHWLRGLCKKGDQCEFLHEYDMTKMPECYFYSKFGKAHDTLGGGTKNPDPGARQLLRACCVSTFSHLSSL